jgi:hypothetical protein
MNWVMNPQGRAIKNIREVLEREAGDKLVVLMNAAAPFKGSGAVFRRMSQATSAETMLDYSAEIRFGLTFKGLRFEIEFEPCGSKGPDLAVFRDGQSTYVEVKRFRPSIEDDGPTVGIGDELMPYGNLQQSVKKIEDELARKFIQVQAGSGIVAFWSDHSTIEDIDFELAIRNMRSDNETGVRRVPDGILFSIFASDWMSAAGQQLYCEALKPLSEPFSTWVQELKRFSMP